MVSNGVAVFAIVQHSLHRPAQPLCGAPPRQSSLRYYRLL